MKNKEIQNPVEGARPEPAEGEKYNHYKDSGIKWIGEIPGHWEVNKVKHNFSFRTGFTPPSGKLEYYENGSHIWINISDLQEKFICDSANKITDKALEDYKPTIVPKNSLLYSFKLSVGRVGFNTVDCYTNEAIFSIDPNGETNLGFFYYSLPQQIIKNANENIYGAKILNQELIKNASLIIPPPKEQSAIATYLDRKTAEIDELIADKKRLIELYVEEKTAVINDLVTGKTVWNKSSAKSDTGAWAEPAEVKDSGIKWLGMIPEDWEVYKLNSISNFVRGNSSFKKDELLSNGKYVALQYGKTYKVDVVDENFEFYVNDEFYKDSQVVNYGDVIIISTSETIEDLGHTAFYNRTDLGLLGGEQMVLKPNTEKVNGKYMYYSSQVFTKELQKYARGIKVFRFNIDNLKTIYISVPSTKEQHCIVQKIETETARINAKKEKAEKLIDLLVEYREALISEVVTGKVKVV